MYTGEHRIKDSIAKTRREMSGIRVTTSCCRSLRRVVVPHCDQCIAPCMSEGGLSVRIGNTHVPSPTDGNIKFSKSTSYVSYYFEKFKYLSSCIILSVTLKHRLKLINFDAGDRIRYARRAVYH